MSDEQARLAVVIEPRRQVADVVAEALRLRGFEVIATATHAGAAHLVEQRASVAFLAAAVPAADEDHDGAYLAVAHERSPDMGVVVMLSDPHESVEGVPAGAVRIVKPFDRGQLETALDQALSDALHHAP